MTGSADCRDIRHALGVYVLGAIDPAERTMVDAHLSSCPECREELASLAGLPALLRRIPVGEAQQLADDDLEDLPGTEMPSDQMLRSLLGRTTRARQARRWRGLAAAAAVVLVAGAAGAVGWGALHHGAAGAAAIPRLRTSRRSPRPTRPPTWPRPSGTQPADWGTILDTRVKNVPAGARCQLVVTDSSGRTTVVGGWRTTYDEGSVWYPGSSAVALDSVRSFEITSQGKILVKVMAH